MKDVIILGIESSCDDTSASIIKNGKALSNVIANQEVHKAYGGVVPELASRAHQQNIIPVVDQAIKQAGVLVEQISAVAYTRGPGLLGSLLVGTSFAKGFSIANNIPLIDVNHLQAHILAHFIHNENEKDSIPNFPFLCLLVSGGHTQIVVVKNFFEMEVIGQTIDDAAGEAFDKCAKVIGLPYPGGPYIDKNAKKGNPLAYRFKKPRVKDLDFSFSGLKTGFLYFVRDELKKNQNFIRENINDLCASLQKTIIDILLDKVLKASEETGIKEIAIAGGVSANSGLKEELHKMAAHNNWHIYIPPLLLTMDNAAMIGITGYHKFLAGEFSSLDLAPLSRFGL